jgi:aminopeptidase N
VRTTRTAARAALAALTVSGLVALAAGGAIAAPGNPGEPRYGPGAPGVGDEYFPYSGNGGYDVKHYDLRLRYAPPAPAPAPLSGQLEGVATVDLVPTQDLDALNFDLRGLQVSSVTINGARALEAKGKAIGPKGQATFEQVQDDGARIWEVTVRPQQKLRAGQPTRVVFEYGGQTGQPRDIEGEPYGWWTTRDGAMVASEPDGSMTWFPVSDHPTDKATYAFTVTVPEGKVAVANGVPAREPATANGWTTWFWDAPDQMASYLATASVGDFVLNDYVTDSGIRIIDAVDSKITGTARTTTTASLARQPAMLDFFEPRFGTYPFNSYGSSVDNDSLGYALETQTRPVYSRQAVEGTVAHELAHMWFGNLVSPARWQDIWLNEGWAVYATWLWQDHRGTRSMDAAFQSVMVRPDSFWLLDISDPGPTGLFETAVYQRGGAALHALRAEVGDEAFFAGARLWLDRYRDSAATTEQFQAVYEEVSGMPLGAFFDEWLRAPVKPTVYLP